MSGAANPQPEFEDASSAAAWWDARLRSPLCTPDDRKAFAAWCTASEENRAAFDRLQTMVRALHGASASDPRLRSIRDRARAAAALRTRRTALAASLVGGLLIGGGALGGYLYTTARTEPVSIYRTVPGERSTVRLADGSVVVLNSKTEVRVSYRRNARNLELVSGEALFDVAKDAKRPFRVRAARRDIVAVGTAFDVRLDPAEIQVTMIEGKVKVSPAGRWAQRPEPQYLTPGQRMVAGINALESRIEAADLSRETAWLEDKVIFEGEPLKNALMEISRHTERPIRIGDASLSNLPISGMFKTTQPENFIAALTAYYPISAVTSANGEVVLYRR